MCTGVVFHAAPTVVLSVRMANVGFLNLAAATGVSKHTVCEISPLPDVKPCTICVEAGRL